jgi:hypothetical protein
MFVFEDSPSDLELLFDRLKRVLSEPSFVTFEQILEAKLIEFLSWIFLTHVDSETAIVNALGVSRLILRECFDVNTFVLFDTCLPFVEFENVAIASNAIWILLDLFPQDTAEAADLRLSLANNASVLQSILGLARNGKPQGMEVALAFLRELVLFAGFESQVTTIIPYQFWVSLVDLSLGLLDGANRLIGKILRLVHALVLNPDFHALAIERGLENHVLKLLPTLPDRSGSSVSLIKIAYSIVFLIMDRCREFGVDTILTEDTRLFSATRQFLQLSVNDKAGLKAIILVLELLVDEFAAELYDWGIITICAELVQHVEFAVSCRFCLLFAILFEKTSPDNWRLIAQPDVISVMSRMLEIDEPVVVKRMAETLALLYGSNPEFFGSLFAEAQLESVLEGVCESENPEIAAVGTELCQTLEGRTW